MSSKKRTNEIKITRIYDAPVAAVWDAWIDPKKAEKWWGPRGFTLTTHSKDLRAGGHWSYTMHGPDGTDYVNKAIYYEVEKHSRLVYDHGGSDDRPPLFRVTVYFKEQKGKTRMEMTMTLPTPEAAEETRKFIKKAGGNATWDRLAEYIGKEEHGKEQFFIHRSFDAPIDTVFEMWINPAHFSKWLGPTGSHMEFKRAEIRPGGDSFYMMTNGDLKMYGRIKYERIERPSLITYTQEFCDENEHPSHHPLMPTWPKLMHTTIRFEEEAPDQTRVTILWEVEGSATKEEMDTFKLHRPSMTQGWTGSLDKLEELLAQR